MRGPVRPPCRSGTSTPGQRSSQSTRSDGRSGRPCGCYNWGSVGTPRWGRVPTDARSGWTANDHLAEHVCSGAACPRRPNVLAPGHFLVRSQSCQECRRRRRGHPGCTSAAIEKPEWWQACRRERGPSSTLPGRQRCIAAPAGRQSRSQCNNGYIVTDDRPRRQALLWWIFVRLKRAPTRAPHTAGRASRRSLPVARAGHPSRAVRRSVGRTAYGARGQP